MLIVLMSIIFIIVGVLSRLIPHIPNFSPLSSIALFSGVYLSRYKYGWVIPLFIYIFSDLIIGLHDTVLFTWGSIALIYFIGVHLKRRKTFLNILNYTLISSLIFFFITNLGVWLMGWYPLNLSGLWECYIKAIPFFRTTLFSDILYSGVCFGLMESLNKRVVLYNTNS